MSVKFYCHDCQFHSETEQSALAHVRQTRHLLFLLYSAVRVESGDQTTAGVNNAA